MTVSYRFGVNPGLGKCSILCLITCDASRALFVGLEVPFPLVRPLSKTLYCMLTLPGRPREPNDARSANDLKHVTADAIATVAENAITNCQLDSHLGQCLPHHVPMNTCMHA